MSEEASKEAKRGAIPHYKDLLVYQQAYRMALEVSRLTGAFPKHEQFELARQMRGNTAARYMVSRKMFPMLPLLPVPPMLRGQR